MSRAVKTVDDCLAACPLFAGLSGERLEEALRFFDAREKSYKKGAALVRQGDAIPAFGLVLEGMVRVCCHDMQGNRVIMATVGPGGTFAESLSYLKVTASPIDAEAVGDSRVLWLTTARLHGSVRGGGGCDCQMSDRFTAMLAQRTLSMNDRIQVLSKRSLREKLMTYFSQHVRLRGSLAFEIDMDRSDLADYLGTDRSALSRELSRMQRDGLIRYSKNRFEIIRAELLEEEL